MSNYNFKQIEKKWQKKWESSKVFEVEPDKSKKKKYYVLEMFPYPSGDGLHMGHAWNYTLGDVFARFKRMMGFEVLHPMGYDSLGLPAENAAIKAGQHPMKYNSKSIPNFTRQMKEIGLSYDWSRTFSTDDSKYYKWDQWIFLKMLEKGVAYKKQAPVNWCPKCETVLANEQVVNGKCWRHDETDVEIKHLEQWFFKITDYADKLLEGHKKLDWPARTIAMQKHWIGKSYGTGIVFEINREKWPIFTTRPDTVYGVTFMVISAQHPRLMELVTDEQKKEVGKFLKKLKSVSEKDMETMDKEGAFTGSYAVNPVNGEKVPIYAGNFVLADYGSGMVMAVPAHDQRDFEFAKKYKIDIKQVISGKITNERAHTGEGDLINSEKFNGINSQKAIDEITKFLAKKKLGKKTVCYKLRDWLISRQRYWGTPIPIIYCDKCGVVPVPEKDLPVELPKEVKFGKGNPLLTNEKWVKVKCPKCKTDARRETDTMDTFVNSSWYMFRYCDPKNTKEIFDSKKVNNWCPVDLYIGGPEHACMHLLYTRFYTKFLKDIGLLKFDEPTIKLFHQGILHAEGGERMSKSKPETCVLPEEVSKKYGMDTARLFLSSLASPDKDIDWSETGIQGSLKFINKLMEYFDNLNIGKADAKTESKLNSTIKDVTKHVENFQYNLAVIKIREFFNLLPEKTSKEILEKSLKLLHPFCPHITEELWSKLGHKDFISLASWPKCDESKIDKKLEEQEQAVDKLVSDINHVKGLVKHKKKVFVYVLPNELGSFDVGLIEKRVGMETKIFAVNDKEKHDPENKSKKVKPGRPGIYLE